MPATRRSLRNALFGASLLLPLAMTPVLAQGTAPSTASPSATGGSGDMPSNNTGASGMTKGSMGTETPHHTARHRRAAHRKMRHNTMPASTGMKEGGTSSVGAAGAASGVNSGATGMNGGSGASPATGSNSGGSSTK